MIAIIDYGMGNPGSILNMFKRIGVEAIITNSFQEINNAEKLILPGVGAFDAAITQIQGAGLHELLNQKALVDCVPILGICLGMHLLTDESEEGKLPGFGWIPASTRRFPAQSGFKIPHMGWNEVHRQAPNKLIQDLPAQCRFYFVHSYYVTVNDPQDSILQTIYGTKFDSAIQHGNIYGVQFHPEKSHKFGMHLLKNFAEL